MRDELQGAGGLALNEGRRGNRCGGCAEEVKDTLVKVDGVSNVKTDPTTHQCTFWSTKPDDEIKAKLDELAKSSDKIAGWERLN